MGSPLLISRIELRFIAASLADAAFQVVRHQQLRGAAEKLEGPDMTAQPIRQNLAPGRFGKRIIGGAQNGDKDTRFPDLDLAAGRAYHGHSRTCIIDKQLLAGSMALPHRAFLFLEPRRVTGTKLRVTVTTIRILPGIFLLQQLLGHAFFLQFPRDFRPHRSLKFRGRPDRPQDTTLRPVFDHPIPPGTARTTGVVPPV